MEGFAEFGLTKREYFAGIILCGLAPNLRHEGDTLVSPTAGAHDAVLLADALIAELGRKP